MGVKLDFLSNKKALAVAVSFVFIIIFASFLWRETYVPKNIFDKQTVVFSIKKGDSIKTIAKNLKSQGLIKNEEYFRIYVAFKGISTKMQAGSYAVSPSMNVSNIAGIFYRGEAIEEKIKIIEGWDLRDIFDEISKNKIYTKDQILTAIFSPKVQQFISDFDYLGEKEKKNSYEGYFFPDTYKFNLETSPEDFVKSIFSNFDKKLTVDLRKEIERQKKTVADIVIMASIIEKEVRNFNDKKIVSGVLWKRLKIGMPLQVDVEPSTYKSKGLPNSPICNPGIESIKAAIYPASTNYLYYLSTSKGTTIFSETFDQHVAAKAKYLR